jgi:hypothetical protein
MAISGDREHVNPSAARKAEPRLSVRQVPLHAVRAPKQGTPAAREPVRQSPPNHK